MPESSQISRSPLLFARENRQTPARSPGASRRWEALIPRFLAAPRRAAATWPVAAEEIAMLLQAGTPLVEAIQTVAEQCNPGLRNILLSVARQILAGNDLSRAMQEHGETFDRLSIQLVAIGEAGGCLAETLQELADYKRRLASLASRTATLLIYPAFVAALGTAAAIFLMTEVMPSLLESLEENGRALPLATQWVQFASDLLRRRFALLACGVGGAVILLAYLLNRPQVVRWRHRQWLRLPLLGPIALQQNLSRLSLMTSVLLRNGVPLNESLRLAAETSTNREIAKTARQIALQVETGETLARAIEKDQLLPPLVKRVFVVGEESGDLGGLLARLAIDLNTVVERRSARLAALIEPLLIVGMAFFVGFLLFAVMQPILESANVIDA